MSRTLELGRAAVSSTSTDLELWLTTLITLSPTQASTNIQHLQTQSLIDYISSGNAWVSRGNGLFINLDLTSRGEPLCDDQLRTLADGIVKAPAWKQLGLQPSLPSSQWNPIGRLHINVGQRRDLVDSQSKSHRAAARLPSADLQPPRDVLHLQLQSVQLILVVTDLRSRAIGARQAQSQQPASTPTPPTTDIHDFDADSDSELASKTKLKPSNGSETATFFEASQSPEPNTCRKRKRQWTALNGRESLFTQNDLTQVGKRPRLSPRFAIPSVHAQAPAPDVQHMVTLVDVAVRLSVSNNLRGSPTGSKIKASTFIKGLSDIAPVLWRPGFLAALSQRAHLIPTLSLSLSRTGLKTKSASLQTQIVALCDSSSTAPSSAKESHNASLPSQIDVNIVSSHVATRIWILLQKSLLSKSVQGLILPFCVSAVQSLPSADQEEILEESPESMASNTCRSALDYSGKSTELQNADAFHEHSPHALSKRRKGLVDDYESGPSYMRGSRDDEGDDSLLSLDDIKQDATSTNLPACIKTNRLQREHYFSDGNIFDEEAVSKDIFMSPATDVV